MLWTACSRAAAAACKVENFVVSAAAAEVACAAFTSHLRQPTRGETHKRLLFDINSRLVLPCSRENVNGCMACFHSHCFWRDAVVGVSGMRVFEGICQASLVESLLGCCRCVGVDIMWVHTEEVVTAWPRCWLLR